MSFWTDFWCLWRTFSSSGTEKSILWKNAPRQHEIIVFMMLTYWFSMLFRYLLRWFSHLISTSILINILEGIWSQFGLLFQICYWSGGSSFFAELAICLFLHLCPKIDSPTEIWIFIFQIFSHIICLCYFDVILDNFLMSFWHNVRSIWEPFWHHFETLLLYILILFRIIHCFHASLFFKMFGKRSSFLRCKFQPFRRYNVFLYIFCFSILYSYNCYTVYILCII